MKKRALFRTAVVAFGVVGLATSAGVAHAQTRPTAPAGKPAKPAKPEKPAPPKPEPKPAEPPSLAESLSGEAKSDYVAAKLLYGNGDFAGALVKFNAAYDKSKDPRLLWNIAACEKSLHHYASVLAYLRRYLTEGASVLTEAEKVDAEALVKLMLPLTATLDLSASETGARVYIDDALVGETPLAAPVVVDVGTCKIRIEKEGFQPYRETLKIGDSPRVKLVAKLDKAVTDATITVYTARANDPIYIDGALRGAGTWTGTVPSGSHSLRVAAPPMRPYDSEFSVRDGEIRTIALTLDDEPAKPSSGRVPTWVWIGGGVVIVSALVVGGYFLFKPDDERAATPVGTLDPGSVQASFPRPSFSWQ